MSKVAKEIALDLDFICGPCGHACESLLHLDIGGCVERSPGQSDTHLP